MKTRAYLKVTSDTLLSEQMVEVLCIVPDRTWKTGDIRPRTRLRIKEIDNGLIIESGLLQTDPLEKHLESLTAKLEPLRSAFPNLSKECSTELVIVYYSDSCNPDFCFDNSFIKFLATINAKLWIDCYVLD